jgi:hypothetical protein
MLSSVTSKPACVGARDLGDSVGPRRAAQPVLAMDLAGVDDLLHQRLVCALVHVDRRAGNGEHRQDVVRRGVQIDIAEHGGDGVGRPAVGDQQQQGLGVVDATVGIEDEAVHAAPLYRSLETTPAWRRCA